MHLTKFIELNFASVYSFFWNNVAFYGELFSKSFFTAYVRLDTLTKLITAEDIYTKKMENMCEDIHHHTSLD